MSNPSSHNTQYEWILGKPSQTDNTNYEWVLGCPFIRHEYTVAAGWTGKISGVTDPAKIMGVAVADIAKVQGVA